MREVAVKSSADESLIAPIPLVWKTAVTTSSRITCERFGTLMVTGWTALLSVFPTGRKYAWIAMSFVAEGLKTLESVRKLLTVPAIERKTSFARTGVVQQTVRNTTSERRMKNLRRSDDLTRARRAINGLFTEDFRSLDNLRTEQ